MAQLREMMKYHGIFSNKMGSHAVEVYHNFDNFYMQIGRFKFNGFDLDSFELDKHESAQQEIFCCADYEIRDKTVGYRGTVLPQKPSLPPQFHWQIIQVLFGTPAWVLF